MIPIWAKLSHEAQFRAWRGFYSGFKIQAQDLNQTSTTQIAILMLDRSQQVSFGPAQNRLDPSEDFNRLILPALALVFLC